MDVIMVSEIKNIVGTISNSMVRIFIKFEITVLFVTE